MSTLKKLSLDDIVPSPDNLRADVGDVNQLAQSIAFIGLLEPIRVYKNGDDKYHIASGHRRYAALRLLEKDGIEPEWRALVIKAPSDEDRNAEMLIENMQRVNLEPLEQAEGVRRLRDEHDMSVNMMATALGVSREWINDRLAMIGLPEDVTAKADDLGVAGLAGFGKLDEDRQQRLLKSNNVTTYKIEEALRKQQSKAKAEANLERLQKEGYLVASKTHIKRLINSDLHEMAGLDQLIKLKLGNAEALSDQTYNGVSVPTATWDVYHADINALDRNELYMLLNQSGYFSFHKITVKQPKNTEAEDTKAEKERARKKAKRDKIAAEQEATIRDYIFTLKQNDIMVNIADHLLQKAQSRYAYRACQRLQIALDIEVPEGWDQSYGETRRKVEQHCVEKVHAYANKSNANLARAVLALYMEPSTPYGCDIPEMPEELRWA